MNRHTFLRALHDIVAPRTYLETGVNRGESLKLTKVPSVGVDPDFKVIEELMADVHLARTTSDEFFTRKAPLAHLPRPVVDLAFVDGMHLSEYALRDFLSIERFTTPASVVLFDDVLPRSADEAARYRHTMFWTGDIFKAVRALRDFRPDLLIIEVSTTLTGVALVLCPDAKRRGILPEYDDWLDVAICPDPQDVPAEVIDRTLALEPERVLASTGWAELVRLRNSRGGADAASIRAAFADLVPA